MYQALYRKYRPQTFSDVVGQRSITDTLSRQVATGKLSHAYLFTGTRGTGKTSCAKILAKAINCEHPIDGNPCNACAACRAIDRGACTDVLEIDAASNNGVDHVRALRDEAVYTPAMVKKRVYIIDEVHMLSTAAFNALLKIIEEPPEHLVFLLATTDLQKVLPTILSRCQRFSFRRLTQEDIAGRIHYVAYQEQIEIEPAAVNLLARLADGALRDGLSLLDQCATAASGSITCDTVCTVLGLAGQQRTAELMQSVLAHDSTQALRLFSELYAGGKDTSAMLDELCSLARDLLILKTAPKAGIGMMGAADGPETARLLEQSTASELLRIVSTLQRTMAGFARSANLRIDTELCLLELCSPALSLDAESISARLSRLEEAVKRGVPAAPVSTAPIPDAPAPAPEVKEAPPWAEDDAPAPDIHRETPAPEAVPTELPPGFWTELKASMANQLGPQAHYVFSRVAGELQGDTLLLTIKDPNFRRKFDELHYSEIFRDRASALLGRPVTVKTAGGSVRSGADPLDDLCDLAGQHPDIFQLK